MQRRLHALSITMLSAARHAMHMHGVSLSDAVLAAQSAFEAHCSHCWYTITWLAHAMPCMDVGVCSAHQCCVLISSAVS